MIDVETSALASMAAMGLRPSRWSETAGFEYASHEHAYDKILVVVRGAIVVSLPEAGGRLELGPGDRLDLPAATRHSASVGPSGVTCLEAHLDAGSLEPGPRPTPGWAVSPVEGSPAN